MRIREAISASFKSANEDAYGSRDDGLWVIDGATPLDEAPLVAGVSPAAWLSHTASEILRDLPWAGRSLQDVMGSLIGQLADQGAAHGLTGREFPTAAISLVRRAGDRVEVCSLGDCTVLIDVEGKPIEVMDPQFEGAEDAALAWVRDRLDRGVAAATVYQEIRVQLRQRRLERNSPAGLWILAAAPEAARHAAIDSFPAPPGTNVVLMSDGFARALWPFGLVSDSGELMDRIVAGGAAQLLAELRAAEAADPDCVRTPRFGAHDDATMVWAEI
ncbi:MULTISPECIES: protein phosphatase 2C domain-containing protein [unclassified Frankia]|uniref:protein phosphatase 2C domain-containing protein n=1 Tax=unclassified Frankia TaxID=2632575 RepID=UPI001932F5FA|nr:MULTISPECIES: protein phosphatase 2C domain-containing protein [unclassified Frankia]MBL7492976.1 protein phosphatase 2C domain-containing protein [Frankia sp. AgW1.1]MBL7620490.1 protein phosphatase 2C domain-containing protein [Frankia sp. AgB1.8]